MEEQLRRQPGMTCGCHGQAMLPLPEGSPYFLPFHTCWQVNCPAGLSTSGSFGHHSAGGRHCGCSMSVPQASVHNLPTSSSNNGSIPPCTLVAGVRSMTGEAATESVPMRQGVTGTGPHITMTFPQNPIATVNRLTFEVDDSQVRPYPAGTSTLSQVRPQEPPCLESMEPAKCPSTQQNEPKMPTDTADGRPLSSIRKKTRGRVKIKLEYIPNKIKRQTTFSKRRNGIIKKVKELAILTGAEVMLVVASGTGNVYSYASHKLQRMIQSNTGKELLKECLNGTWSHDRNAHVRVQNKAADKRKGPNDQQPGLQDETTGGKASGIPEQQELLSSTLHVPNFENDASFRDSKRGSGQQEPGQMPFMDLPKARSMDGHGGTPASSIRDTVMDVPCPSNLLRVSDGGVYRPLPQRRSIPGDPCPLPPNTAWVPPLIWTTRQYAAPCTQHCGKSQLLPEGTYGRFWADHTAARSGFLPVASTAGEPALPPNHGHFSSIRRFF